MSVHNHESDGDRPTLVDVTPTEPQIPRRIPSQVFRLWGRWIEQARRPELPKVFTVADIAAAYKESNRG